MQGQPGKPYRALIVHPLKVGVIRRWHNPEDRRVIALVKAIHRTPDIGWRTAIIDKEGIRPAAAGEEISAGAAVEYIVSAMRLDRIVERAALQKPIVACHDDVH